MNPFELREKMIEKSRERRLVMLTAYDYQMARILDEAGIDMILIGDSLGMTVMGYKDTKSVTIEEMIHHTRATGRGVKSAILVGDMPIHTYDTPEMALKNARRFIESGAHTVKIEGNKPDVIQELIGSGIPVMGHLGLLPQTAKRFKVKGKRKKEAEKIFKDAQELDSLGVFSIVLESIPKRLAKRITKAVDAPTIGIGAGVHCDGQVLVINDLLGMDESFKPKFVKRYAHLERIIRKAVRQFIEDVQNERFPDEKHTYH